MVLLDRQFGEAAKQDGGRSLTLTIFFIGLLLQKETAPLKDHVSTKNEFIEIFRLCFEVPTIEYNFEIFAENSL